MTPQTLYVHIVVIGGNTKLFFASFFSLSALGLLHFFSNFFSTKMDDPQTHFGPLFRGFGLVVASGCAHYKPKMCMTGPKLCIHNTMGMSKHILDRQSQTEKKKVGNTICTPTITIMCTYNVGCIIIY